MKDLLSQREQIEKERELYAIKIARTVEQFSGISIGSYVQAEQSLAVISPDFGFRFSCSKKWANSCIRSGLVDAIKYQKAGDYDHSVIGIKGVDYDSGSDIKNYLKEVVRMIARGV